jgi:prevent-host-death family protein
MNISATELNKRPGTYLEKALRVPVVVEKSGRPSIVLISYDRFIELENFFWGEAVKEVEKDQKFLSVDESQNFLEDILKK